MNAKAKTQPAKRQPALTVECTQHEERNHTVSVIPATLVIKFSHGKELTLETESLSPEILSYAICHGLKQKLVDAAAISRNQDTGRSATVDDKYHAVNDVFGRLLAGEWNKRREGGGASGGLLYRALVRVYEGRKTPDQIKEWLDGITDAQKAALRKNPKVSKVIDEIRAEDGTENDGEDLLAELEDFGAETPEEGDGDEEGDGGENTADNQ